MLKRSKKLSADLSTALVICVALVSAFIIAFNYYYRSQESWKRLERTAEDYTAYLGAALVFPVWNLNRKAVSELVQFHSINKEIVLLEITDTTRTINHRHSVANGYSSIIRKTAIKHQDHNIGEVVVGLSTRSYYQANRRLLINSIVMVIGIIVTIIAINGIILKRLLYKPFYTLQKRIDDISNGDYDNIQPNSGYRELDQICLKFEEMAARIKTREQHLKNTSTLLREEISDRKKAQEELKSNEQKLQNILDFAPPVIYLKDLHGKYIMGNKQFEHIYQVPRDQIAGLDDRQLHDGDTYRIIRAGDDRIIDTGTHIEVEEKIERNGKAKTYSTIKFPLKNTGGEIYAIGGISTDITVNRHLESQLRQAQKLEAIGTLASGVAHDFNNILQAISGYIELMLLQEKGRAVNKQPLNQMQSAIDRAADLIRRLLIFSRKSDVKLKLLDLNNTISHAMGLLERTLPKMIQIRKDFSACPATVYADPVQMEQVLMNMGVNAGDAMPDGGTLTIRTANVTLTEEFCRPRPETTPGDYVLIEIDDTGAGMDQDTLQRVFEPFFTTKGIGKGTGLGLATVYGIVKHLRGHISCNSRPGMGTNFKLYIPSISSAKNMAENENVCKRIPISKGNERILVVDDEETVREIAENALNKFGYTVTTAENGEQAIETYKGMRNAIDLVILDLGMPGMGGLKCLKALIDLYPQVKVLIASGYGQSDTISKSLEFGAAAFIKKPYHILDLGKIVRNLLDGTAGVCETDNLHLASKAS
ncbi:MAG: response regulator [Desulfobacteraceae bacterium]|nr:response regulator [Desulfobacteraceae bacterium]